VSDPLAYMLKVMNDPTVDAMRRDRMAVAAAPYVHSKSGELGKKVKTQQAAKAAGTGKFAPSAPPKLVVSNR
jgi:phage terminase small subunit